MTKTLFSFVFLFESHNLLFALTLTSSHPALGSGSVTLARRSAFSAPSPECVPSTRLCTIVCCSSSTRGFGNQSAVREGHSSAWVTTMSYTAEEDRGSSEGRVGLGITQ